MFGNPQLLDALGAVDHLGDFLIQSHPDNRIVNPFLNRQGGVFGREGLALSTD